jgi:hypothetical protein
MAKAKNEAKIKFTAETGEFNDAIKKSNNEMSKLRAELKLNEAQMKNTDNAAETLQQKHKILSEQLKVAGDKTEALSQKLNKAVAIYGENSDEVTQLERQLANARTEEEKLKTAIEKCTKEMKDGADGADDLGKKVDGAGDAAKNSEGGFTVMKGVIADLASQAIQLAIGKISEFIGYLMELPEATRELRQDFATLDTSFESMGFSTETAAETWKGLYSVFGEDDRAVEAANLIVKMADDEEDLSDWLTITAGVWGTYQDSLPVEGLAEAANETAKVGTVTGVLADALNWSSEAATMFAGYMSEDVVTAEDAFNEALKECTTEQERQALINETLIALYGDAATKYEEASGAQIAAKEATADNTLAQANLATAMEPVTTAWTNLKTSILEGALPAVEKMSTVATDALGWMQEHPKAMQAIAAVLAVFATAFTLAAVAVGIYTAAQWAMNSAMLASPITWIVLAITALIAIIAVCVIYWDEIKAAAQKAWQAIKSAWGSVASWFNSKVIQPLKNFFSNLWSGIKSTFSSVGSWFRNTFNSAKSGVQNAWSGVKNFFVNIWNGIKNAFSNAKSWFSTTFNNAKNAILKPIETARDKIKSIVEQIKGFFSNMKISLPKIKVPKISVTGKFSIDPPSVPKFSVSWNAKGAIFTKPTIFNTRNGFQGVGEAGAEAVLPIEKLQGFISNAIDRSSQTVDLASLAAAIDDLANRPIQMNINGRQFAVATAGDSDSVNGLRSTLRSRGLELD